MAGSRAAAEVRDAGFLELTAGRTAQLYRSACLLTGGDTHLAEDLVQDTLARMYTIWRRQNSWLTGRSRIEDPGAYAYRVLVRTFLAHRKRRSSGELPIGELPEGGGAPDDDSALRLTLLHALAQLGPKDRAVLVLRHWEDRSIEETAEVMQCSPGAVRTRTTRALARLRAQLGDSLAESAPR
ncbi:SigE family RNA polymerase sigma factor [Kitasatospora sp. NPDC002040]|uniref:SigE family RNA polymerase sigma factor n=1 Tax=Kitasatospora sp. NPDC002040 TaxID=3154661 RepID=UPI00332A6A20